MQVAVMQSSNLAFPLQNISRHVLCQNDLTSQPAVFAKTFKHPFTLMWQI